MNDTPQPPADSAAGADSPESREVLDDTTVTDQTPEAAGTETGPTATGPTESTWPQEPAVAPVPQAYDAAGLPEAEATPGSPWKRRLGLAGAAAGLVVAGGLGGFALGHATADDDGRGDRYERMSFDGGGSDGDGPERDGFGGFGHHGDRGPGQPPGLGPDTVQPQPAEPDASDSNTSGEGSGSST